MSPVPNEFAYWRIQLVSKTVNDTDTLSVQPQVTVEVKVGASQQICGISECSLEKLAYISSNQFLKLNPPHLLGKKPVYGHQKSLSARISR